MNTPTGPVLTRRQALRAAAVTAVVAVTAPMVATATAAPAGAAQAARVAAPIRLRDLPLMYGTPTDLARTAAAESDMVWTLDADGTVLSYDRGGDFWTVAAHQDWATVLTFGTVRLARWGRPSGANQMVLVFGTAPESPPTTPTDPTTPIDATTPTGTTNPTTSSALLPPRPDRQLPPSRRPARRLEIRRIRRW